MNDEGLCLATISASKDGPGFARDVRNFHELSKRHNNAAQVYQAALQGQAIKQATFDARLTAMESALPLHVRQFAAEGVAQATRAYDAAVNADQRAAMAKQAVETCDSRVGALNDQLTAFEKKIDARLVEVVSESNAFAG
jgi:protein involved in temperature-dependent protein secretion